MRRLTTRTVLVIATFTWACAEPQRSDILVIGEALDVNTFFPLQTVQDLDAELSKLLFLGLNSARWDDEDGTIDYVADDLSLAERWEYGPDSTSLTYYLRSGAAWSDGEPITAQDVVFTYKLLQRPELALRYQHFVERLDSVTVDGPTRATFHFARRYPHMLLHSGLGIIPQHVYAEHVEDAIALRAHPSVRDPVNNLVVSGPFRVATWRPGERLMLVPNPYFHGERARLERVVFRFIPDATARLIELRSGGVDVINPVPPASIAELVSDPRFRIESRRARFYDFIIWNDVRFPAFGDPRIRQALSLAIDRRGILKALQVDTIATPAAGPYPKIFRELHDPSVKPDPYRADSARALLTSLGWIDRDGDGVRERDGQPFRFTLLTTEGSGLRRRAAAEIVQAQLAEIGVDVALRLLESGTLIDVVFSDEREHDFEAALVGWRVSLDPALLTSQFWPPEADFNVTGYRSAVLDTVIPAALHAARREEAARFWRAAERTIARDRPYAFLWFYGEAVGLARHVNDYHIDIYSVYQNLHRWRLEP